MASTEEKIQKAILSLEGGKLATRVWRCVLIAVAIGLSVFYLTQEFRGLPIAQAMDQAQIGREILRGHGWATEMARPLAIGELRRAGKDVKTALWVDTYNAPIPPLLDAAALYLPIKNGWDLTRREVVYSGDRAIALMGVIFFLASVLVLYFIAKELFDQRLAYFATGIVLICEMMWRYAISGLPQSFLLLLFHLIVYAMLRAMGDRTLNRPRVLWLAAIGLGFGLMALTNALSIFIFAAFVGFALLFFRPRWGAVGILLGMFLAVYTPWLVRNALVCGDPRGLAGFSVLDGIVHPEAGHMRRFEIDLSGVSGNYFAENFRVNLMAQIDRLFEYLGWSCAAPIGLISMLHAFRRPATARFQWLLLAMWASAVCGMGIFGMKEERLLAANQFHLLFVPLLICYGVAYVLVQWDRRIGYGTGTGEHAKVRAILRLPMVVCIFLVSGIPLISRMFIEKNRMAVEWPPYVPPYIAAMRQWFAPNEIIASDMPWAVAWYADRKSIWLPYRPEDLVDLKDYNKLGAPIPALLFTPISGTENTLGDLISGEYSQWTSYIVRTVNLTTSPYPVKVIMGMREYTLYLDSDRQKPVVK